MSARPLREDGNLAVTLSAWMVLLHRRAALPVDEDLAGLVQGVCDEASGTALVDAVRAAVGGSDPGSVLAFAQAQYGEEVHGGMGHADRDKAVRTIRRYQFARNTPWLCRIYERHHDVVQPTWVIVERVTDEVLLLDPEPFDDVEEERTLPLADFLVLWELDGATSVVFGAC
ncbi:MAG: hypothetical protein EP330_10955 [Deltaproteobacteria bacterium]|nr:MAG: hypothetical protein EP330_10955 [Deltaproteobacteria bacterium]